MLMSINHKEETVDQLPQIFPMNTAKNSNINPEITHPNSPLSIIYALDSEEGQTKLTPNQFFQLLVNHLDMQNQQIHDTHKDKEQLTDTSRNIDRKDTQKENSTDISRSRDTLRYPKREKKFDLK